MDEDNGVATHELVRLLKPFWSAARTMEALGLDEAGLMRVQAAGDLLTVATADGVPLFPDFQFMPETDPVRVWPGLRTVLRVLKDEDQWSVAVLL